MAIKKHLIDSGDVELIVGYVPDTDEIKPKESETTSFSVERRSERINCNKQCAEHLLRISAQEEDKADIKILKENTIPAMRKNIHMLLGASGVIVILFGFTLGITKGVAKDLHDIMPVIEASKTHVASFPEREVLHHETSIALGVMANEMKNMNININNISTLLKEHVNNSKAN